LVRCFGDVPYLDAPVESAGVLDAVTRTPESEIYHDPFQREMSLKTVRDLITSAHRANMAAMPYLAVYAASLEFRDAHLDWALYDDKGNPLTFHDFLGYMDPSPQSHWTMHLLRECVRINSELEFDGYHVDQYGEPKQAYNASDEEVDLSLAFSRFVEALKEQSPEKPVVFNAVGNWPIDALAASQVDFVYIEVWPPDTSYEDLAYIVLNARELSAKKPVVVALYIPASQPNNLRLAEAVLFAYGSTHIAVGEQGLLLSDPYFPHSDPLPAEIEVWLQRYWDFLIRYQHLLGPAAGHLAEARYMINSDQVLISGRSQGDYEMVNLINFTGLPDAEWAEAHDAPEFVENLILSIQSDIPVRQVWIASPDCENPGLIPALWEIAEAGIRVSVPLLSYWTSVIVKYDALEID